MLLLTLCFQVSGVVEVCAVCAQLPFGLNRAKLSTAKIPADIIQLVVIKVNVKNDRLVQVYIPENFLLRAQYRCGTGAFML